MWFRRIFERLMHRTSQDGTASASGQETSAEETSSHDRYTQAYIGILKVYRDYIEGSVKNKSLLKKLFFLLVCIIMIVMIILFFYSIRHSFILFSYMVEKQSQSASVITGAVTAVVSSFVTMTTSILVLPKIVARYLFNKKEDKSMMKIIGNIQKYEINAVELELERIKSEKASTLQTGNSESGVEPTENGIPSDSQDAGMMPTSISQEQAVDDASAIPVHANTAPGQENSDTGT